MAQFAILLHAPAPADIDDLTPEEVEAHGAFGAKVAELGGEVIDPQALQPSTTARLVSGGAVTEGAFTSAKGEVLSGYFILEARDIEHASDICKHSPGSIEIRPLYAPPAE